MVPAPSAAFGLEQRGRIYTPSYTSLSLAFYIAAHYPGVWFSIFCLFKTGIFMCGVEGKGLVETPLGAIAPIMG